MDVDPPAQEPVFHLGGERLARLLLSAIACCRVLDRVLLHRSNGCRCHRSGSVAHSGAPARFLREVPAIPPRTTTMPMTQGHLLRRCCSTTSPRVRSRHMWRGQNEMMPVYSARAKAREAATASSPSERASPRALAAGVDPGA